MESMLDDSNNLIEIGLIKREVNALKNTNDYMYIS